MHVYLLAAGCHPKLVKSLQEAVALTACLMCFTEDHADAVLVCLDEVLLLWGGFTDAVAHLLGHDLFSSSRASRVPDPAPLLRGRIEHNTSWCRVTGMRGLVWPGLPLSG